MFASAGSRLPSAVSASSRLRACIGCANTQLQLGGLPFPALGSVRTKKWKPFHSMYRANYLRELRQKKEEAPQESLEASTESTSSASRAEEPTVATSPFQAARIMRAFDVFPEKEANVTFWTRLNVDLTRESVRGTCHLPHGLQTKIRVLAFCPDDEVEDMLAAGADFAGISEPLRRINQGWLGFDRCLATAAIMPQVMKVSRVLGPRKLMPNPKSGTVVQNLRQAIKEAKGGTLLEYRAEGQGELRAVIGDATFSDAKVLDNMKFLVQTILRARPRGTTSAATMSGEASAMRKAPGTPLIPTGGKSQGSEDKYFLEAKLQLGSKGPPICVDPDSMMPSSVGYFR